MSDIFTTRIVPVIVINNISNTEKLCQTLMMAGQKTIEITLRTAGALEAIEIAAANQDMCVGAGTVLTEGQVSDARAAGAEFIVSPGFNPEVVKKALSLNLPVFPGCITPSEIMAAQELGLKVLKFFPANVYGGAVALKALSGVFSDIKFIPTGGVGSANLSEYLELPNVQAVGGSWMASAKMIDAQNWEEIKELTSQAVKTAQS